MNSSNKLEYVCIFGGGAVRGISYIGVLDALETLNIDIKKIAGSSIGALFATFFAVGYSTFELTDIFKNINFQIFKDINFSLKPQLAISKGEVFYEFIKETIEKKYYKEHYTKNNTPVNFADLDFDLFIFTSDLTNCKPKIFSRYTTPDYEIAKAVRISASLPGLMNPVVYEDSLLVDGDLIKSWPLWLIDDNLISDDYRVLEFRLEGGKILDHIKNPIDYANAVISCVSNYATDRIIDLYGEKDKFDYIVIDTKDLLIMDLNISYERRLDLIKLGFNTTINYFKNNLFLKKKKLKQIYSSLLDSLIKINNKITLSKFFEAKIDFTELFVELCNSKHFIDSIYYKQILDLYSLYKLSLEKTALFNLYHLNNKKKIIQNLSLIIDSIKKRLLEIIEFENYYDFKLK